jgi:hypothetical protein
LKRLLNVSAELRLGRRAAIGWKYSVRFALLLLCLCDCETIQPTNQPMAFGITFHWLPAKTFPRKIYKIPRKSQTFFRLVEPSRLLRELSTFLLPKIEFNEMTLSLNKMQS